MIDTTLTSLDDGITRVDVHGELDHATVDTLGATLDELADRGATRVVIDLSNLRHVSSSGLAALVRIHLRLMKAGGDVRVTGTQRAVRKVIEVTNLDKILTLHDTAEDALAAMREG